MKYRVLALFFSVALMAGAALAHGDLKHIIGTLEKATPDSVTVKIADGSSVEVKLVAATMYVLRSGNVDKPAKSTDLAVGYRVVIHAKPVGDTFEAAEVRFSPPTPASKPKS